MRVARLRLALLALLASSLGCQDISRFSSSNDHYEGAVVQSSFVRALIGPDVRLCLTLSTDRLQDTPGVISTSDGRFGSTPLRPIPQIWHDPLSTLSFGEGREKNLVYVASSKDNGGDVMVVVSLMKSGSVEVRLLRGAPDPDAGSASGSPTNLFAVFYLERAPGPCSF
jgi:hypothetical protein